MVYDSVKLAGGPLKVPISKEMFRHARLSSHRYKLALENKKKFKSEEDERKSAKIKLEVKLKEVVAKRNLISSAASAELTEIDREKRKLDQAIASLQ